MPGQHAKAAEARELLPYAGFRDAVDRLSGAQKAAARSAPAYSRFVNRRMGRYLAAAAFGARLTPNMVTGISALFTFSGIALLISFPPSWGLGILVSLALVLGYALDSADGQLARLTGAGSPAGEWLDHIVDALKTSTLPLALLVGLYRFAAVDPVWLLVPLGSAVVSAVVFFSMILTEQLRRQAGVVPGQHEGAPPSWLRAVLVVPMDYGVLCLSFMLYGATPVFLAVYTAIFAATTAFLALSSVKWFRELTAVHGAQPRLGRDRRPAIGTTMSDAGA
ncbi:MULTISPECIES: CDP-alcohol phosphatidyltransferase family protein [Micrococcaceae]|jgi:phosphatidylglycerophosphate synthase|uniref:CDP-alcohol phosphatidyltransferase family protein n=1 Tax=Micrococcaceae TaxID=1268 RepID=UPI0009E65161|nr:MULTISPECIES: CDP-alcohol phosphatidyltransferase family protein [Micrococcaceae]